jgi:hypothetical protein
MMPPRLRPWLLGPAKSRKKGSVPLSHQWTRGARPVPNGQKLPTYGGAAQASWSVARSLPGGASIDAHPPWSPPTNKPRHEAGEELCEGRTRGGGRVISLSFSPSLEDPDLGGCPPLALSSPIWQRNLSLSLSLTLSLLARISSSEVRFTSRLTTSLGRLATRGSPWPPPGPCARPQVQ